MKKSGGPENFLLPELASFRYLASHIESETCIRFIDGHFTWLAVLTHFIMINRGVKATSKKSLIAQIQSQRFPQYFQGTGLSNTQVS